MAKITVVDIDGTLAVNGEPNKPLVDILRLMSRAGYLIIIATGRSDDNREWTEKWLKTEKIPYTELLMMPAGTEEKTRNWKEGAIKKYLEARKYEPSDIEVVWENHKKTGKMWAGLGVPTFLVYGEDD